MAFVFIKAFIKNPVSRLGRLVRQKKYQEAIELGKTVKGRRS
ncbi:MAG: hypothetical protein ABII74_06765 [Elusimicrobiota bacterium]